VNQINNCGAQPYAPTPTGDLADIPLWAYGVAAPPRPGDTADPQRAPGPWFDPAGSKRSYTLLELNDVAAYLATLPRGDQDLPWLKRSPSANRR